jgi:hypothetical protein
VTERLQRTRKTRVVMYGGASNCGGASMDTENNHQSVLWRVDRGSGANHIQPPASTQPRPAKPLSRWPAGVSCLLRCAACIFHCPRRLQLRRAAVARARRRRRRRRRRRPRLHSDALAVFGTAACPAMDPRPRTRVRHNLAGHEQVGTGPSPHRLTACIHVSSLYTT